MTLTPEARERWLRLERFVIDDPMSPAPYSARLARENGWSWAYAQRVITEYKRFLFLVTHCDHLVVPSKDVDQAWHTHLLYTRSYWGELCGDILGRKVHHEPSRGAPGDREKFQDGYRTTLESYRAIFGAEPPVDVWPAPVDKISAPRPVAKPQWVDRATHWVVRKPSSRSVATVPLIAFALLVAGCSAFTPALIWPYSLPGGEFLGVYVVLVITCVLLSAFVAYYLRGPGGKITPAELPCDPYAVALLAGGSKRAISAAVARLVNDDAIRVSGASAQSPVTLQPNRPKDLHPLEGAVLDAVAAHPGIPLRDLVRQKLAPFEHLTRVLESDGLYLRAEDHARVRLVAVAITFIPLAIGVVRLAQGLANGRPVGFLVVGLLIAAALTVVMAFQERRTRRGDSALQALRREHLDLRSAGQNLMSDPTKLALGMGLFGAAVLVATPLEPLGREFRGAGAGTDVSGASFDSSSSTNSSSCGGSSDGGGSGGGAGGGGGDGGGSGCGGCGGGGGGD